MPLDIHKDSKPAHRASMAAHRQGKFWEFHDKLFAAQRNLKPEAFNQYAEELGLDKDQFLKDSVDPQNDKDMEADIAEARALGVTGTPGVFVNGRFLRGAKPFEDFAAIINDELRKKNIPIPPGAPTG